MRKLAKNKLSLGSLYLVSIACFFTAFFNSYVILARFYQHKLFISAAIFELIAEIFFSFILTLAYLYAFSIKRYVFIIGLTLLFLFSSLSIYFSFYYQIKINETSIALLFETTRHEVLDFLDLKLVVFLVFSLFIIIIIDRNYYKMNFDSDRVKKWLISFIFLVSVTFMDHEFTVKYYPFNYMVGAKDYFVERIFKKPEAQISPSNFSLTGMDNTNIILVLGESLRSDHLGLNGYERDTTPNLRRQENLLNYPDVYASAILTRNALPHILSRENDDNKGSITLMNVFGYLGFNTAWFGAQGTYSVIDSPFVRLANEAKTTIFLGTDLSSGSVYDEDLVAFTKDFLDKNKGNNFVVLHSFGSHWHYESRYPDSFRQFTPTCSKKFWTRDMDHCSQEEIINSYDNSVLYTDYFLSNLYESVKDTNSMIVYVSDHGEALGENGMYMHGFNDSKEQRLVPMLVMTTKKYQETHKNLYENLKAAQKRGLSHKYIFHSLLGCNKIESEYIEAGFNLCAS